MKEVKVKDSKEPTIQRMLNMSTNLRDKFKKYAFIEIQVHSYSHGNPLHSEIEYWFSVDNIYAANLGSWPEVIAKYRELMND